MGSPAQAVGGVYDPFFFRIGQTKVLYLGKDMKKDCLVNLHRDAAVKVFPAGVVKAVVVGGDTDKFFVSQVVA